MLKKILVASLAAGALALGAPVAHAEPTSFDCGFDTIAQEDVTGGQDTFTGIAYGYVIGSAPTNSVSITCWVRVDGTRVAQSPTGTGTGIATTAGQVTYTAGDTQDVDLCADWTDGATSGTTCFETTTTQIPPQEVIDLINMVFDIIADATEPLDAPTCMLITALDVQGTVNPFYPVTGLYVDHSDCDVSLNGERLIDFSPYGDAFGPPN